MRVEKSLKVEDDKILEDNKFKNILMINNYSMFEPNPVGITLASIFSDWPDNQLFEIYRYRTSELDKDRIKMRSLKLPASSLPIDFTIRRILHKEIKEQKSNTTWQIALSEKLSMDQQLIIAEKYFAESLFICKKNSQIYEEIEKFNPQVIYTIGESLFTLKASLYFSQKFDLPVVIHYMDNWRETIYPNTGLLKIFNHLFSRNLQKLENRMKHGLVISPKMKEEYSLLNPNVAYSVLLNSVLFDSPEEVGDDQCNHKSKEIIFTYIGGLHLNRWESLLNFEKCICELNKMGIASKLYIYSPEPDKVQFIDKYNPNFTIFKGYLPHAQISRAYKTADILVHTESFNSQVIKYTKYSLSTKIPECMAAGKPILFYAPNFLAVAEYINNTGAGISVDNYNDLLKAAINLSTNEKVRAELGENGIKAVLNAHTQENALKTLLDSIQLSAR